MLRPFKDRLRKCICLAALAFAAGAGPVADAGEALLPTGGLFTIRNNPPTFYGGGSSALTHQLVVAGDMVYLADGYAGVVAYRIAARAQPRLVGEYPTGEYTRTVRSRGSRIYASDSLDGLVRFEILDSGELRRDLSPLTADELRNAYAERKEYREGDLPCLAAIVDRRVYISREDLGVAVIELRSSPELPPPPFRNVTYDFTPSVRGTTIEGLRTTREVKLKEISINPVPFSPAAASLWQHQQLPARFIPEIAVSLPEATPELTASLDTGILVLRVSGRPGQTFQVQRKSSLLDEWEDWQSVILGVEPTELTDPDAAAFEQMFYRVRSP